MPKERKEKEKKIKNKRYDEMVRDAWVNLNLAGPSAEVPSYMDCNCMYAAEKLSSNFRPSSTIDDCHVTCMINWRFFSVNLNIFHLVARQATRKLGKGRGEGVRENDPWHTTRFAPIKLHLPPFSRPLGMFSEKRKAGLRARILTKVSPPFPSPRSSTGFFGKPAVGQKKSRLF